MKLLALETSTMIGSIALSTATELLAEFQLGIKTSYSEKLLPAIDHVLYMSNTALQDIDAFAIAQGPGSFTSLRIGMSVIKGLSLATNKPLITVSSLDGLAHNMFASNDLICPLLDARRHEVYTAFYKKDGNALRRLCPDRALRPEMLLEEIHEDVVFLGDGSERYRQLIGNALRGKARFAPLPLNYPRASTIAHLAFQKGVQVPFSASESLTPLYGRPPEAEIKWGKSR
jgi:tRNA threonylcarbamoyladenosine biosynthesis protein TsaB